MGVCGSLKKIAGIEAQDHPGRGLGEVQNAAGVDLCGEKSAGGDLYLLVRGQVENRLLHVPVCLDHARAVVIGEIESWKGVRRIPAGAAVVTG